jgi:hypothetical protein
VAGDEALLNKVRKNKKKSFFFFSTTKKVFYLILKGLDRDFLLNLTVKSLIHSFILTSCHLHFFVTKAF